MRKIWPAVIAAAVIAVPLTAYAQEATQAGAPAMAPAAEVAVGTTVENRALVGAAEAFPVSAGKVACFARITNAQDTEIEFVWYKGDVEQARVKQSIKGSPWRTWSTKTLPEDAAGEWRCDVVQGETVLSSVKFTIE